MRSTLRPLMTAALLGALAAGQASASGARMPLGQALHAFSRYSAGIEIHGRGDVDYWLRTYADARRATNSFGRGLIRLADGVENPGVRSTLDILGRQLRDLDPGDRGNVRYWMSMTEIVEGRLRSACQQLRSLGGTLADRETVGLREAARAAVLFTDATSSAGRGDVQYWLRAAEMIAGHSRASGYVVAGLADGADGSARVILGSIGDQLLGADASGHGDVDYWMAKASGLSQRTHDLADQLEQIAETL